MTRDLPLSGKKIILGVTGSIAAYKAAEVVRLFKKRGADVQVVLSDGAKNFIRPLTFQTLSGHAVLDNAWKKMEHIDLTAADALVVAPATANFVAKAAVGLADDLLTSTLQAFSGPVVIAPAMNDVMYVNQKLRQNIRTLQKLGYRVVEPQTGDLACGRKGQGRLADPEWIVQNVESLFQPHDLAGKTFLITAGPTREYLDPVRFLSNGSSGKMGIALAQQALERGARVVLVLGPAAEKVPPGIQVEPVETTEEMLSAVKKHFAKTEVLIGAAAPADFAPIKKNSQKIKKEKLRFLSLRPTPDVLAWCGAHKKKQVLVGFALETTSTLKAALGKIKHKNLDAVVLNSPKNVASEKASGILFLKNGKKIKISPSAKTVFARKILDVIADSYLAPGGKL